MFYFWIGLSERQQKTGSMDLKKNGLSMYDELSPKLYAFSIYNTKSKYSVIFNLIWFSILRFISMPPSILQQSVSPPAFTYSKSIMKTSEQFWKLHKVNKKDTRTNDVILLFLLSTLNRSHPLFWSFHWFGQVNANWETLIWKSN